MPTDELLLNGEEKMEKAIANLKREFANVRTGRANPMILDKIQVDYYGMPTPIRQVANVTVQDGQTLVITPFDRNSLLDVEKAIAKSDLGLTPNNDGSCVRITFPQPTEERRRELVKSVKKLGEEAKVAVRNIRRDMVDDLKKLEKSENLPEDVVKGVQDDIQKLTDKYTKEIDSSVDDKEKEVMTV
ncbi:MAG: ribosome recycling factor [Candidatus Gastranaerophilales bacterium]|nr:ribosome recycling factor [Candidatus Gastranaerophilales bacterium]